MSSNSSSNLPATQYFPDNRQLDGSGMYIPFKDAVKNLTRAYGLLGYLDGRIPRPSANAAPAVLAGGPIAGQPVMGTPSPINSLTPSESEWDLRDGRLAGIIFQNIKDPRGLGIDAKMNAKAMLDAVNLKYGANSVAAQTLAQEKLRNAKFNPGDRFDDHFKLVERLRSEANEVGCSVQDPELLSNFLTSLPESYLWILQNYSHHDWAALTTHLLDYQLCKDLIKGVNKSSSATALVTSTAANQSVVKCTVCSRHGHTLAKCWAPGGGSEGKGPAWYKTPKHMSNLANAMIASTSGDQNMPPPTILSTTFDLGSDLRGTINHNSMSVFTDPMSDRHRGEVASILKKNQAGDSETGLSYLPCVSVTTTRENNKYPMYLDSAASECCVWEKNMFIMYTSRKSRGQMAAEGSNGEFPIEGYGVVEMLVKTSGGQGFSGSWGRGRLEVKDPKMDAIVVDGTLASARNGHWLYEVSLVSADPNSKAIILATETTTTSHAPSLSKPCSLAMWHTCFAHINTNTITLVNLDLWGKARTCSLGGAWYMLLAVDNATGLPFPYFPSSKEAATILGLVKTFVVMAEKQTGRKIKHFHIDMGWEFDNRLFDEYTASIGVLVEKIPKDSSAANGQVERANCTVIEGVCAMLEDSTLGCEFWAEAASAFCYIKGMLLMARVPEIILWQKWKEGDHRVNVSHLCHWGCRIFVKDLDQKEGKLGLQAWEGWLVGYLDRCGYRVWDPKRRAIFAVRDVVFDEGVPNHTVTEGGTFDVPSMAEDVDEPGPSAPTSHIIPPAGSGEVEDVNPGMHPADADHEDEEGVILRQSARRSIPSQALQRSQDYQHDEDLAQLEGDDWANVVVLASAIKGASDIKILTRFKEAMENSKLWFPAMKEEIWQLTERGCWSLVPHPEGVCVLNGMWVYDVKVGGNGEILKTKAHYIARGDMQRASLDYDKCWSMVARMESVCLLIATGAFFGWKSHQWDFSLAYLNGNLPDHPKVYMRQPTSFVKQGEEELVCLLKKPLYGLSQASHIWFKELKKELEQIGFHSSRADPCIHVHYDSKTGSHSIHSVHTDDVWSTANSDIEAEKTMMDFSKWDWKDVKDKGFLVGLTMDYLDDGSIGISQAPFFTNAFKHFGIWDKLQPILTPLPPKYSIMPVQKWLQVHKDFMKDKPFH
ncbi:hypothetical protein GYMLUDRAFT_249898 [Collybiopsis luxurians FD-317 M1]|uniref:Integrase catalytic domain-containing protein n=1 Tax=Collybiopsis luxurians FD-317 M1 TaxID=944289 RepID=A0A0D0AU44_9AGAR|nr:hypothetical protein GYMLUDRAFT_249898 [Collybiopsis luxurians FD-317 M1]